MLKIVDNTLNNLEFISRSHFDTDEQAVLDSINQILISKNINNDPNKYLFNLKYAIDYCVVSIDMYGSGHVFVLDKDSWRDQLVEKLSSAPVQIIDESKLELPFEPEYFDRISKIVVDANAVVTHNHYVTGALEITDTNQLLEWYFSVNESYMPEGIVVGDYVINPLDHKQFYDLTFETMKSMIENTSVRHRFHVNFGASATLDDYLVPDLNGYTSTNKLTVYSFFNNISGAIVKTTSLDNKISVSLQRQKFSVSGDIFVDVYLDFKNTQVAMKILNDNMSFIITRLAELYYKAIVDDHVYLPNVVFTIDNFFPHICEISLELGSGFDVKKLKALPDMPYETEPLVMKWL